MLQETQDINCAFVFYLLQHAVYYNVGACPAHTSAGRNGDTQLVPLALPCHELQIRKITISMANECRNNPNV